MAPDPASATVPPTSNAASASLSVRNEELWTVREAMRELNRLLDRLDEGEVEKLVLTQRNRLRAVIVSVERYCELEAAAPPAVRRAA